MELCGAGVKRTWWPMFGIAGAAITAGCAYLPIYTGSRLTAAIFAAGLLPVLVAILFGERRYANIARPVLGIVLVLVAIVDALAYAKTVVLVPNGSGFHALISGSVNGWARTLDGIWPLTPDIELAAWIPVLVGVAVVLGIECQRRLKLTWLSLLPALLVLGLSQAFTVRRSNAAIVLAAAFVVCAAFTVITARLPAEPDPDQTIGRRTLAGVGRVVPVALAIAVLAPSVAAANVVSRDAYQLKDHRDLKLLPRTVSSPLDQIAERLREPNVEVFDDRTDATVDRWTLADLDVYDGVKWTSSAKFKPLSSVVPADPSVTVPTEQSEAVFRLRNLDGPWLPTFGRTQTVHGLAVVVDPKSGGIARGGDLANLQYRLDSVAPAGKQNLDQYGVAPDAAMTTFSTSTPVPEKLRLLASQLTADTGPTLDGAFAIEQYFRKGFSVVRGGSDIPSGHSYAQLTAFATDSRRGTSEQFAAAFVVLARAAGIPARVAVGFIQPAKSGADGTIVVHNRDVAAWPEVHLTGIGWIQMDPTGQLSTNGRKTSELASATDKARALATSPRATEHRNASGTGPTVSVTKPNRDGASRTWLWIGLVLLVLCLPFAIPLSKAARRRRRRRGPASSAVVGAWLETRDHLRDHRIAVSRGMTASELAALPASLIDEVVRDDLLRLALHVDLVLWSGGSIERQVPKDAWAVESRVCRRINKRAGWRRVIAFFSPMSLMTGRDKRTTKPMVELNYDEELSSVVTEPTSGAKTDD
jgi:transglutaminase-like putative cysteine protease